MSSVYKLPSGLKKDEIMKRYRAYPKIKQLQAELDREKNISKNMEKCYLAEHNKHRWIPVGERLPKENLEILFIFKNHVYKGEYGMVKDYGRKMFSDDSRCWYNPEDVTHWKPIILPEKETQ